MFPIEDISNVCFQPNYFLSKLVSFLHFIIFAVNLSYWPGKPGRDPGRNEWIGNAVAMRVLLLVATVALATGEVVQMDRIDSADLTHELLLDYMRRDVPFVVENKHATGDGPNAWRSTK